jgi:ATP-binding protein involved in chromosome partitioning
MAVQEKAVLDALRTVQDPELHKDLVTLNMIKDIRIGEKGDVELTVVLTTPACPLKPQIESDVKAAVMRVPGVKSVKVDMGSSVTSTVRPQDLAQGIRNIIGVASGKGGVGKSTVAVNLAVALAQSGAKVGILDADIYGPNVPLMMGLLGQQPDVVTSKDPQGNDFDVLVPLQKFVVTVMSMGFLLREDQPVVWRGPMLNSAIRQFLAQVQWGELDYLIVDLPPGTGDVQISLMQMVKITGIVSVSTPQDVALQDVRKGIVMFQSQHIPMLGIIENMSYFICPHCNQRTEVFSHGGGANAAEAFGLPFLGEIPLAPEVRVGGDTGVPIVISHPDSIQARKFQDVARQLAARVSITNYEQAGAVAAV